MRRAWRIFTTKVTSCKNEPASDSSAQLIAQYHAIQTLTTQYKVFYVGLVRSLDLLSTKPIASYILKVT
jgi:hypothetical protein